MHLAAEASLDDSIAQLEQNTTRPSGHPKRRGRPRAWIGAALLVIGILGMVQFPPAPDYSSTWRNGVVSTRDNRIQPGTYTVPSAASLVLRPSASNGFARPQVKVWVGPKGQRLMPADRPRLRQGTTGAIRVTLPISTKMSPGTHTVVVLLGKDLSWADPRLPAWWWSRVDTEMIVTADM